MTSILHLHNHHQWSPEYKVVVFGRRVQRNRVMPPVPLVSLDADAASAPWLHLAEPAAQATDPRLSHVPSQSDVPADAPAAHFAVEPDARVDEPDHSFAPSSATVDSAGASVAASPLVPPVDDAAYVDVARSHCQSEPYPVAHAAVSRNDPAPAEVSPYAYTAMPASYVSSATVAQCLEAPSSFLGSNCQLYMTSLPY